jgi:uncharacterized protein (DUF58 family)
VITRPLAPAPASAWAAPAGRWPFAFGPRFFVLMALGLLFLAPAWIDPRAVWLLVVWNAIVIAAWGLDVRQMPRPGSLRVSRLWRGPLALGVAAAADLEVENHGAVAIQVRATDHAAGSLRRDPAQVVLTVLPGAAAAAPYELRPRERGDVAMGVTVLRYRSGWGLAERWALASVDQTVRVYPDLQEARRQSMYLVRSRQVALEKRRARIAGLGRDFESLREYRAGDQQRDICWTATARRAKVVTRVYQPERSQAVWILVDAGRLLRERVEQDTKLDRTVNAALALTQVALGAGDRVALLAYGRRTQHRIMPGRGPQHLRAIVEALATVRSEPVEADHAGAAALVMRSQKPRALIVWLTDLAETAGVPDVIESASMLSPRHVVLFTIMRQPELTALGATIPTDRSGMYRVLAAQETLERRERLLGGLRQRGALALELTPDDLTASLVSQYLTVKDRNMI